MSAVIPFQFETHAVRTVVDDSGEIWFVGKDIADALGYANTSDAIAKHCKGVAKRYPLQTPGGVQEVRVISEPDVFRLAVNSKLPSAEKFERWVFEEVLPSIRKTGTYALPGTQAPAFGMPYEMMKKAVNFAVYLGETVGKWPGVKDGIAKAAVLTSVQEATGFPTGAFRRALPANTEPICSLNATKLGKLIGLQAKATNLRLAQAGFQARNARDEWELTEAGEAWAEALPYTSGRHSGYQILWNPAVADALQKLGGVQVLDTLLAARAAA